MAIPIPTFTSEESSVLAVALLSGVELGILEDFVDNSESVVITNFVGVCELDGAEKLTYKESEVVNAVEFEMEEDPVVDNADDVN